MTGRRTGILGGTFDPIHFAHLAIAEQAREQLGLTRVLFVPASVTVHKLPAAVTPVGHRLAMVALAIGDNPFFELSREEAERHGPSYTVDTLEELCRRDPSAGYVLIMSVEAARELATWRRPERILELAEVAVVPRLGYEPLDMARIEQEFPGRSRRFTFVDAPTLGHSASDIRARAAGGRSIRYLVPSAVEEYIVTNNLYRNS